MASHQMLSRAFQERLKAETLLRSLHESVEVGDMTAEQKAEEATLAAEIKRCRGEEMEEHAELERASKLDAMYEANGVGISRALAEGTAPAPESAEVATYRSMRDILRSVDQGAGGIQRIDFGGGTDIRRDDVALVTGTATDGAELIETELSTTLVDYLQESIGAMRAGARVVNTTSGNPITIPTVTSHSTILLEGETDTIARSAPQFSTVSLGSFKYAVLVQISRELLEDSAFPVVPFVIELDADDSGRVIIATAVDLVFTLPATATGLVYTFVVGAASATTGLSISPAAADSIGGLALTTTDNKDLINTAATDRVGDSVTLVGVAAGWLAVNASGTWAKEA